MVAQRIMKFASMTETKDEYIIKKMSNKKYTSNELEYCAFIHAIRYVKKSFYNIKRIISSLEIPS